MKFFEPILRKRLFQKLMRSKIKIEVKNYSSSVRRVGSARHRKEQVTESSETEIELLLHPHPSLFLHNPMQRVCKVQ